MTGLGRAFHYILRIAAMAGLAATVGLTSASSAGVKRNIAPYLEVQQVLDADLNGRDVLTYTTVAAGADAQVATRRVRAQMSYRYEYQKSSDRKGRGTHDGGVRAEYDLIPKLLTMDLGGLATRALGRGDRAGRRANGDQVYGLYLGPNLKTKAGGVDVVASYRLGLVHVDEAKRDPSTPAGIRVLDTFGDAINHSLLASLGMGPRDFPIGWTLSLGYAREDANLYDRSFEAAYARADFIKPVSRTLALVAGVGYEKAHASQQDIKRDSNGVAVLRPDGTPVADPTRRRLDTYDKRGFSWDAGLMWRPSRRTEFVARIGERHGDRTITGSLRYKISPRWAMSATAYDSISSFGLLTVDTIGDLPGDFVANASPSAAGLANMGGCVFGETAGSGACLGDTLHSTSGRTFRNRGVNLILTGRYGPWSMGLGGGVNRRNYGAAPSLDGTALLPGEEETAAHVSMMATRILSRSSAVNLDAYASWYDSTRPGARPGFNSGVTATYNRRVMMDRLYFYTAIGLYRTDDGVNDKRHARGMVGLRYRF